MGQIQVAAVQPLGQSFTATLPSVGAIWLRVINMNMDFQLAQDKTLTLELHAGGSLAGTVLGTSTVDVDALIGSLRGDEGLVEFGFGHVPVLSGQTYSFEVKAATTRFGVNWLSEGHYGGGQALLQGTGSAADLYFSVAAAVPEPAAYELLLLGLGLMVVAPVLRRR